jgi:2',3'-cyclic-nucleotide 2'-phosphodiesterase (5'-nucleotidase family)
MQGANAWTLAVLLGLAAGCASDKGGKNPFAKSATELPTSVPVEILFVGGVSGRVGTCGCAVNPKGGLDRRLNYVRSLPKNSSRLVVDAGNTLLRSQQILPSSRATALRLASEIMAAHREMGVQVQGVGALDLGLGKEVLKELAEKNKIVLVSSNLQPGSGEGFAFSPRFEFRTEQADFVVLALTRSLPGWTTIDAKTAIQNQLASTPKGSVVVVLSDLGTVEDRELASQMERPTIWIGSRELGSLEIPVHLGRALILQTQIEGQQWGRLEFAWGSDAKSWTNLGLMDGFRARWDGIQSDKARFQARGDAKEELERLTKVEAELRKYEPREGSLPYRHQLVDMGAAWAAPNEWTKKTQELSRF